MALLGASAALAQQAAHASDRVFGRVLDADGNPAPDATVEFLLRDLSSPSLPLEAACRFEAMAVAHVVRSDTRGAFEATLDPSRLWAVHARTASGLESVVHAPLATGQIVTLTVLPTIALEGVVVAPGGDANPVPGARLMLGSATRSTVPRAHATAASGRPMLCLSSGLFWNIATAVADERGRFRIASVRDVPGFLVAFGEPGATQRWFDGSASQEMQVVLEGPRLRGRVTGPDGGLAGAFLAWSNGVHEPRRSGPEGSFEIPKSITDRLLVSAPGLVPAAMNLGDDGFAGQKELRVRLRRERVVTAQIVDGAETPCADVRVIYCIESYESFSFPIPFEARTDAEGRVALGVPRAESRVTAWAFFANRWLRIGSLVPGDESTFGTV
ncbi:MAG: hypothetical protein KDE27_11805, partial [Planctomycetes bacterium]|nr:hypothetical protein [Planctomycetota bacterium]